MRRHPPASPARQRGAVLMIGLVLLLMLTLVAVGVVRLSMRHTQIVNNEQVRTEATAAANYALDAVLNSPSTTWGGFAGSAGEIVFANLGTTQSADTEAASVAVTVNNLECKRARLMKNAEFIKSRTSGTNVVKYVEAADSSCIRPAGGAGGGTGGGGGGIVIIDDSSPGVAGDDSLCGTVLWEMQAQTTDPRLLASNTTVTQGVEVRETVTTLADACK